jgi:hypothetical protein
MSVANIGINNGDIPTPVQATPKPGFIARLTQLFWSIIEFLGLSGPKTLVSLLERETTITKVEVSESISADEISGPPPSETAKVQVAKTKVQESPKKPLPPLHERFIDADLIMIQWQLNIQNPNYCRNRFILGKDHGPCYVPRIDGSLEDFSWGSELGAYHYRAALEDVTNRFLDSLA